MITTSDIHVDGRVILAEAFFNRNFIEAEKAVGTLKTDFHTFVIEALFRTDMRHELVRWSASYYYWQAWEPHAVTALLDWFNLMKYHANDMDTVVYDVLEWYSALTTPALYRENETWQVIDFIKDILSDYHCNIPAWLDRENDPDMFMSYASMMVEKILFPVYHLAQATGESLMETITKCDQHFNPTE